jgi:L-rhamnose mutarotase
MIHICAYTDESAMVGKENAVMKCLLRFKIAVGVLFTLSLLLSSCATQEQQFKRVGRVAIIGPEKIDRLKRQHSVVGPGVPQKFKEHGIHNHSIYLKDLGDATHAVFSYFETQADTYDDDILPDGKGLAWTDMEEVFHFAGKSDMRVDASKVQRHGMVVGLKPGMVGAYKMLHKYAWPEVLDAIKKGNIRNYSIYLHKHEDKFYLFSYFEYVGDNFDTDMAMIDNDPATKAWIKFTDKGCQIPIPTRTEGEWWANMEEVFHSG